MSGRWIRTEAAALALASALAAAAGPAQGAVIAFGDPRLQSQTPLRVSVAQVADGGSLPQAYALEGRNLSPPISWTPGPDTTRGYVVIVQDADSSGLAPAVHWLAYDIPPETTGLARALHNLATLTHPLGVEQGRNDHGGLGYSGPNVAQGGAPHHYHFQVFALDRALRTRPGADISALERDMGGHVVARGELIATYTPPPPTRAPGDKDKPASGHGDPTPGAPVARQP